ncbi:MAG: sigma-70 family RNA polymerase sigma factor [Ruminococcus sp.]|nr:sigma-70 family RNA polymerase sigma factor [Ruminococcus sp.]
MDDHLIIELFFKRSEQAIVEATEKYGNLCQKLSYQIVGNKNDAEECVNDALLAVWDSIPPNNPNSLPAYLCRITRNLSIKKLRSNTAKKRNSFYDKSLDEISDCIASRFSVDSQIDSQALTRSINNFLDTIHPVDRSIFVQRYWFCYDVSMIAKHLNKSENYISVHLHRTKTRLKKHLIKEDFL